MTDTINNPLRTRLVPKQNLERLAQDLAKLNKRASKLGCAPLGFRVVGAEVVRETIGDDGVVSRVTVLVPVEPYGDAPKIEGWSLAARLEHHGEAGNIVARNPSFPTEVPVAFRTSDADCAHCGLDRKRKDSFVVHHDDGTFKQVGRNCLVDFLGHKSPEAMIGAAELLIEFCASLDDEENGGSGSGGSSYSDLHSVLVCAAACIRVDGWMSRARAEVAQTSSTADTVATLLYASRSSWDRGMRLWAEARTPTATDITEAKAAREWAKALPVDGSEYESNLRVLAHAGYCERLGTAVSMVWSYQRAQERLRERERAAQAKPSAWQGTVGVRGPWKLLVERVLVLDTAFGTSYLHKLVDVDGNRFTWFGSSRFDPDVWVRGKATVKAHTTWTPKNGDARQETQITRATFETCAADAPAEDPKPPKKARVRKQAAPEISNA